MDYRGTYNEFRDALRAFESGWDRAKYNEGGIQDEQLNELAGGSVQDFYPNRDSWGDLDDDQWNAMSYRSMNAFGFVGYQFGEALLIDLGYYDHDVFYGNGAVSNSWDGSWTGKNNVQSLDDFMTPEAQEVAIQEAFGYHLQIIEIGLSNSGRMLDDFIGREFTYQQDDQQVSVTLTLTGILAAAHMSGAYSALAVLLGGDQAKDESRSLILQSMKQFGAYESPSLHEIINFFQDNLTGRKDESDALPHTGVPKEEADVVITWSYGEQKIVHGFDTRNGVIFVDWISSDQLEITETADGVLFSIPSNGGQTLLLSGVTFADLTMANFSIQDASAAGLIRGHIESSARSAALAATEKADDFHDGHHGHAGDVYKLGVESETQVITEFDSSSDMIHILEGVSGDHFQIREEDHDMPRKNVCIVITDEFGKTLSTTTFQDVRLSDLSLANFSVSEQSTFNEVAAAIGETAEVLTLGRGGGCELVYNNDGSNPPEVTGTTEQGGSRFRADVNADDIVGFNPETDELDFSGASERSLIVTKAPSGEIVIDSPWKSDAQIIQGITFHDVHIADFGVVEDEHLRQDLGGIVSWEHGMGPREDDTVYIRSHEYGLREVISDFDPATMKISFLYYGMRERLSVDETNDGLLVSTQPTGQSFLFEAISLDDLVPGHMEFHASQVMDDNLEAPFDLSQDQVTIVSRDNLLTARAPADEAMDGHQTRVEEPAQIAAVTRSQVPDDGVVAFTWAWGENRIITDFSPSAHKINIGWISADQISFTETEEGLLIALPSNGGQNLLLEGIYLDDLSAENFEVKDPSAMQEVRDLFEAADDSPLAAASADQRAAADPDPADMAPREFMLDWHWGKQDVVRNFNPEESTVNIRWLNDSQFEVEQTEDGVLFTLPGNGGRSLLLAGITAADLTVKNIRANDKNAQAKIDGFLANPERTADARTPTETNRLEVAAVSPAPRAASGTAEAVKHAAADTSHRAIGGETVHINWDWAAEEVIMNFDPATDTIDLGILNPSQVQIKESRNGVVIEVLDNGGHTYTLNGITLKDLSPVNFEARDISDLGLGKDMRAHQHRSSNREHHMT
ncbi:hypothetical protein GCM10007094_13330 [Pseudovibrio japonicus]|uniref:Uncharacterized protein n=1 Tax=Pseudovibrio japonicus TaxID=366534 RepID=A0ABQ3E532_9HYPH|nr:1,4-beta-glucanase [Pseudovibrio japonicus]GHB26380.1 hypothetical protein GCM10007094_13330 [Pseudovibrio japonicus]